jgi:predicted secreted Zn-dependent protease
MRDTDLTRILVLYYFIANKTAMGLVKKLSEHGK